MHHKPRLFRTKNVYSEAKILTVKLVTHGAVKPRAVAVPIRISVRDHFLT